MHGLYTYLEDLPGPNPDRGLHEQSHGEGFLEVLDLKFGPEFGKIARGGQRVLPKRTQELGYEFLMRSRSALRKSTGMRERPSTR